MVVAPLQRLFLRFVLPGWFALMAPALGWADQSIVDLTKASIRECEAGCASVGREQRLQHFLQSQTLAERAIALDERFPDAHFALFCTLGEQLRLDGEQLTSIFGYRRMM